MLLLSKHVKAQKYHLWCTRAYILCPFAKKLHEHENILQVSGLKALCNIRLSIGKLGGRSTATEGIAVALLGKSAHFNRPGSGQISGFGLPLTAITKN